MHPIGPPSSLIKSLCFFIITLAVLPGRAQLFEDFSDGEIFGNPAWEGETYKFRVEDGSLMLFDTARTGSAYISTPSRSAYDGGWECYFRYDGNPSSSNRADFILLSDRADLSGPLNGYYLRIGEQTGTDDQAILYRQTGDIHEEIVAGTPGAIFNSDGEVSLRIFISREEDGTWAMYLGPEGTSQFVPQGSAADTAILPAFYCGLRMRYTASRSEGAFIFDDMAITGAVVVDSTAPKLLSGVVLSPRSVSLNFSEPLHPSSAEDVTNYFVDEGPGMPIAATIAETAVTLGFATDFVPGLPYTLQVSGMEDLAGNLSEPMFWPFVYYETTEAHFNDVIATEIHADPSASTELPDVEFVEWHNPTSTAFQLEGWTLRDAGGNTAVFPRNILAPGAHLITCAAGKEGFLEAYGPVTGLSGFPTLNNDGDDLVLSDANGQVIFHLQYSDEWYGNSLKAAGGWSLEIMETALPCQGRNNWTASTDPAGGTPGRANSVQIAFEDRTGPVVSDLEVVDHSNVRIYFNEKLANAGPATTAAIDGGLGAVTQIALEHPGRNSILLTLPGPMEPNRIYELSISGLTDCVGNIMEAAAFELGVPVLPLLGDLLLNEILFNPRSGNVDFVELYNRSENILSTADLLIAESDGFLPDSIIDHANLRNTHHLIMPGGYCLLAADVPLVLDAYYTPSPESFLEVGDLPNFADDGGVVSIYRTDLTLLDRLEFSEDWHLSLLDDLNGVSLERIGTDQPTQDRGNWHSAASAVGFATPGYLNSATVNPEVSGVLTIHPRVITPNGDGKDEFALISYQLEHPGFIGSVLVYDSDGRLVRQLARAASLGSVGQFKWDGTADDGRRARSGLYIILADLFDEHSRIVKYRQTLAIDGR